MIFRTEFDDDAATRLWQHTTTRERDVAAMVAEARTNGEIAAKLGIKLQSAKNAVWRITQKAGMDSKMALAVFLASRPKLTQELADRLQERTERSLVAAD